MVLPDRAAQMALQPSSPSLFSRLASNHRMGIELVCLLMLTDSGYTDRRSAATVGLSAMQKSVDIEGMLSCALCCR
jgi:hypothetical protein